MGTDVGVRLGLYPHTDLFAMLAHPAAKFRYTPPGVVRGGADPSGPAHRESAHSWAVGYVCGG